MFEIWEVKGSNSSSESLARAWHWFTLRTCNSAANWFSLSCTGSTIGLTSGIIGRVTQWVSLISLVVLSVLEVRLVSSDASILVELFLQIRHMSRSPFEKTKVQTSRLAESNTDLSTGLCPRPCLMMISRHWPWPISSCPWRRHILLPRLLRMCHGPVLLVWARLFW